MPSTVAMPWELFLSTPSARRATKIVEQVKALSEFLSTPSARRATPQRRLKHHVSFISIHALREEGDQICRERGRMVFDFYPRPPRGGRLSIMGSGQGAKKFLSTPSARRATSQRLLPLCPALYFYPRPPRGGRPCALHRLRRPDDISIHALREEGDGEISWWDRVTDTFLSTPSARRATILLLRIMRRSTISIHALREEGDHSSASHYATQYDFYPRPPRGGRRNKLYIYLLTTTFLSTPSARRATRPAKDLAHLCKISIHALREEGDSCSRVKTASASKDFYPRPPRGGRPTARPTIKPCSVFLSTPSARRATYQLQAVR